MPKTVGVILPTDKPLQIVTAPRQILRSESMKEKLKKCPFCAGKAKFLTITNGHNNFDLIIGFTITCEKCKVQLPKMYETRFYMDDSGAIQTKFDGREEAIKAWNNRG